MSNKRGAQKRSLRVMLDSNAFDRLALDTEARQELENRRELSLYITEVQKAELAAVPDPGRRAELVALATGLCRSLAAPTMPVMPSLPPQAGLAIGGARKDGAGGHQADDAILAASERCDLLVTDDRRLAEAALKLGRRCLGWDEFVRRVVFGQG